MQIKRKSKEDGGKQPGAYYLCALESSSSLLQLRPHVCRCECCLWNSQLSLTLRMFLGLYCRISSTWTFLYPNFFKNRPLQYFSCFIGGLFLLSGLFILSWTNQDETRHLFGHAGGNVPCDISLVPYSN